MIKKIRRHLNDFNLIANEELLSKAGEKALAIATTFEDYTTICYDENWNSQFFFRFGFLIRLSSKYYMYHLCIKNTIPF